MSSQPDILQSFYDWKSKNPILYRKSQISFFFLTFVLHNSIHFVAILEYIFYKVKNRSILQILLIYFLYNIKDWFLYRQSSIASNSTLTSILLWRNIVLLLKDHFLSILPLPQPQPNLHPFHKYSFIFSCYWCSTF